MLRRCILLCAFAGVASAQGEYGIAVPVTLSGGAFYTHRLQVRERTRYPAAAAVRAMLYPTVRLGSHWFGYAALQVHSTPYFYYDAFNPAREIEAELIQGYIGYTASKGRTTIAVKAGQLVSAFGSFPLRYDDAENPLMDQPLSYIQTITLRHDQLSCGTADLRRQTYGSVAASCGGAVGRARGLTPVTLYGLRGAQVEVSSGRVDGRFQVTSGSPANPQGWTFGRYLQWTAGAGFTIRQGLRVGASGFRGPYLSRELAPRLPASTTVNDFPATAAGIDAQWSRGRFNLGGEWHRFRFDAPNFTVSPSLMSWYGEGKVRLTPRYFVAGRAGRYETGRVVDTAGVAAEHYGPRVTYIEPGVGAWINRRQLVKLSYAMLRMEGQHGTRMDVLGVQFVTTLSGLQWAAR